MTPTEIPLTRAAQQLGWAYQRTWNAAMSGLLEARQTDNGRWITTASAVERLKAQRTTAHAHVAA